MSCVWLSSLHVSKGVLPHSAWVVLASTFKPASHYLLTGAGLLCACLCVRVFAFVFPRVWACACILLQLCCCCCCFLKKENKCLIAKLVSSHASSVLAWPRLTKCWSLSSADMFRKSWVKVSQRVWEGKGEKKLTFILLFILNVYIFVLF